MHAGTCKGIQLMLVVLVIHGICEDSIEAESKLGKTANSFKDIIFNISVNFPYFANIYRSVKITSDGSIGFAPSYEERVLVFYNEGITNADVRYREEDSQEYLNEVDKIIQTAYGHQRFQSTWTLIVTWPVNQNLFQCVLVTDGHESFSVFQYQIITTIPDGVQSGFSYVNNNVTQAVQFPSSLNMSIVSESNAAQPGLWIFRPMIGPLIICPADYTSYENPPVWDYPDARQPDLSSPTPTRTCSDESGTTTYEYGTTNTIKCSATDKYGNSGSCAFNIYIASKAYEDIANLTTKNVTNENVDQVATDLETITDNSQDLTSDDIVIVTDLLEDIVSVESPDIAVTEAVVGTVDNLLLAEDDESVISPATSASILESLEDQLNTSASAGCNLTQNEETLGVQTLSVKTRQLKQGIVFGVSQAEDGGRTVGSYFDRMSGEVKLEASINLPKSLFDEEVDNPVNISFAAYYSDVLFPATVPTLNVSDVVISATVYNGVIPDEFQEPVIIQFNKYSKMVNFTCVYWDEKIGTFGNWSSVGCEGTADVYSITCRCTHLTSFAVLVSRPNDVPVDSPSTFDLFLTIVTYVGCAVSIVCLTITIAITLSLKSIRKSDPQKILVSLSFSLLFLYIVFVCGVDTFQPLGTACIIVAVLLHYLVLTSIAWTAVEAANMYFLFINVFSSPGVYFFKIASTLAWGLPLIPVVVLVAIELDYYTNEYVCYISETKVITYGVILPTSVVVFCNSVMFGLIIYRLYVTLPSVSKHKTQNKKDDGIKTRLTNAIAISTLLGLTWIFGFLSFGGSRVVMSVLFCVLNPLQGLAIFLLFVLRRKESSQKLKSCWDSFCSCLPSCTLPSRTKSYHVNKSSASQDRPMSDTFTSSA